jgi:hypothetical protein
MEIKRHVAMAMFAVHAAHRAGKTVGLYLHPCGALEVSRKAKESMLLVGMYAPGDDLGGTAIALASRTIEGHPFLVPDAKIEFGRRPCPVAGREVMQNIHGDRDYPGAFGDFALALAVHEAKRRLAGGKKAFFSVDKGGQLRVISRAGLNKAMDAGYKGFAGMPYGIAVHFLREWLDGRRVFWNGAMFGQDECGHPAAWRSVDGWGLCLLCRKFMEP